MYVVERRVLVCVGANESGHFVALIVFFKVRGGYAQRQRSSRAPWRRLRPSFLWVEPTLPSRRAASSWCSAAMGVRHSHSVHRRAQPQFNDSTSVGFVIYTTFCVAVVVLITSLISDPR
jgi:hypothetical protein